MCGSRHRPRNEHEIDWRQAHRRDPPPCSEHAAVPSFSCRHSQSREYPYQLQPLSLRLRRIRRKQPIKFVPLGTQPRIGLLFAVVTGLRLARMPNLANHLSGNIQFPEDRLDRFPLNQRQSPYLCNNETALIDYVASYRAAQPVSTSRAEGCVDEIVNARIGERRRMRWSDRGAQRVAIVGAAVLGGRISMEAA